jgi:hypothetical protein
VAQDPFAKTLDDQIAAAQKHLEKLMLDKQMAETQARLDALLEERAALVKQITETQRLLDALLEQRTALAKPKPPQSINYK